MNRREMLGAVGTTTAGLWGLSATLAADASANEAINIGCIGVGGRCRHLMRTLKQISGTRVMAICDVCDFRIDQARKEVGDQVRVYRDYRKLLDNKDIDAVLIATPDHLHVPIAVAACRAGKDIYVEKPLTHSIAEGQAIIDARDQSGRIVQVGTQQRSMPHLQKAFEIIKSGRLGAIHKAHLTWNRNTDRAGGTAPHIDPKTVDWKAFLGSAPEQPFDAYRLLHWRWFWDFGAGLFTDLMVHWLDVVYWYCGLDHPAEAVAIGDFYHAKGVWQTPDTVQTLIRYPDKELQVYFEGTFVNARNHAMAEFMGTDATLYIDRGRYELYPERGKGEPEKLVLGEGDKGADFYKNPDGELLHLANWVECMRSRKEPAAPVEAGVRAAAGAHLANQALRSGETARWK